MPRLAFAKRLLLPCALVALLASGGVAAQVDCTTLAPQLQARCAGINRLQQLCGGLDKKERQACERDNAVVPVVEDCRKVHPAARAMCEDHNRMAETAEVCNGLRGKAQEACRRTNGLPPARIIQP